MREDLTGGGWRIFDNGRESKREQNKETKEGGAHKKMTIPKRDRQNEVILSER